MKTGKKRLFSILLTLALVVGLMPGMGLTAYASTEKSETITTTTAENNYNGATVNGTYFTISNIGSLVGPKGMVAYGGITVSPKNTEYITKVVITCGSQSDQVSDNNTSVSSGSKAIEGSTITVTNVNANTFTFTCKSPVARFNQFVVYYLDSATPASSYSVTITAGDHMTKTTDSGAASQTGLSGAMTDVVYTANDGYYFPTDYSVADVNGISVTRDSSTQITVSGTPSANAEITLTAPTAKTTPDAPTTAAAENCTTADNNDGKLTGVTTAMEYKKSDAADWTAGTGSDITGLVPGTYYVRVKATETTNASTNQELTIKGFISYTVTFKVVNGKWNEGEGDAATADKTVTLTGHDGDTLKLTADQIPSVGTKPNDTYKAGSWDVTPSADTAITGATTYTYTYAQKESISQTVTFKVANGKWDDGTTADKTVTLTGYEGDTLKLAANQIPAVGTKPNDTYKTGSWDVTPNTTAAIIEATTYTYTYSQKNSISQTVTFKVANGKWDDGTTANKTVTLTGYEGDTLKLTADQIPAVGTKPNDTYKAGSWDVTPSTDTAITADTTYTYTYAQKDSISQTVTFKVVNGSWDDETTTDKTVTLTGYEGDTLKLAADQIPTVGTKPNDTYKAGSWDVTPSTDIAITAATTYTYTYVTKEAAVVTKAPEGKTLTYNGQEQALVTAGEATGGEMQYALGTKDAATQPYTTSIPTATDAEIYYVWYKVAGDENHSDTEPACVSAAISAPVYVDDTPATQIITIPVSGEDESVNVTVEVQGETATITGADVDKVLEAGEVGIVTVDVSSLNSSVNGVVIPNALLTKVADAVADKESDADGLEVKLPTGSVVFDEDAVAAIKEQSGSEDLKLVLDNVGESGLNDAQKAAVNDIEVEAVYDAYMTAGGKRISDFKGGSANVTVAYELKEGQVASGVQVWYIADDGGKTQVPTRADGRFVFFTVEHFSNYVVVYDEAAVANCQKDEACPISAFTDIDPNAWYHDGVHWALANGIMSGYGNGIFKPNAPTSRAMIVQILYNLEGRPAATGAMDFDDVAEGAWYYDAVRWAYGAGIIDGYGNGKFGPDNAITREQMAAILYRHAKTKGQGFTGAWMFLLENPDASAVSSWADEAMHWMVMNEVIKGRENGMLDPKGNGTRAEIAMIMMRYCTLDAQ